MLTFNYILPSIKYLSIGNIFYQLQNIFKSATLYYGPNCDPPEVICDTLKDICQCIINLPIPKTDTQFGDRVSKEMRDVEMDC